MMSDVLSMPEATLNDCLKKSYHLIEFINQIDSELREANKKMTDKVFSSYHDLYKEYIKAISKVAKCLYTFANQTEGLKAFKWSINHLDKSFKDISKIGVKEGWDEFDYSIQSIRSSITDILIEHLDNKLRAPLSFKPEE